MALPRERGVCFHQPTDKNQTTQQNHRELLPISNAHHPIHCTRCRRVVVVETHRHVLAIAAYYLVHVVAYSLVWYLCFSAPLRAVDTTSSSSGFLDAVLRVLSFCLHGVEPAVFESMRADGPALLAPLFVAVFVVHTAIYTLYLAGQFTFAFIQVGPAAAIIRRGSSRCGWWSSFASRRPRRPRRPRCRPIVLAVMSGGCRASAGDAAMLC